MCGTGPAWRNRRMSQITDGGGPARLPDARSVPRRIAYFKAGRRIFGRDRGPSATAELIALSAVFLSGDARLGPVVPDGAAELSRRFLAAAAPGKLTLVRQLS